MAARPNRRLAFEEKQKRFRMAEELLTRFFTEVRVRSELMRLVPCTRGVADALIRDVKASWLAASLEDHDERRARLRACGEAVYSAAMNRTVIAAGPDGRPIRDPGGNGYVRERIPDLKQANVALTFLARLDGLLAPPTDELPIDGDGLASLVDAASARLAAATAPQNVVADVPALPSGE